MGLTMKHTKTIYNKAVKKVQIAIDKMIALQDLGLGNYEIQIILNKLNQLQSEFLRKG